MQTLKTLGILLILVLSFSLATAQSSSSASGTFDFCPDMTGSFDTEWEVDPVQENAVITDFFLYIGTSPGKSNYYRSLLLGSTIGGMITAGPPDCVCFQNTFGGGDLNPTDDTYYGGEVVLSTPTWALPVDGRDLYIRLWFRINGTWGNVNFVRPAFFLCTPPPPPTFAQSRLTSFGASATPMLPPTVNSLMPLTASSVFTWLAGVSPTNTRFLLFFGTSVGGAQYGRSDVLSSLTFTKTFTAAQIDPLAPPIFVRFWYRAGNGTWSFLDYMAP